MLNRVEEEFVFFPTTLYGYDVSTNQFVDKRIVCLEYVTSVYFDDMLFGCMIDDKYYADSSTKKALESKSLAARGNFVDLILAPYYNLKKKTGDSNGKKSNK